MPFDRDAMKERVAALAASGVYIGTSSWKYPGWRGMLYDEARYVYRGKIAESRFEKNCLAEYAEVFKTVCVDAAYYTFPGKEYLQGMADQVPEAFRFGFKVTDAITIKQFPTLPRFGIRAGQPNRDFLNADLFATAFLKPMEAIRPKVGVLMFEFSKFYPRDFARGQEFTETLDRFLGALPPGWPYAVEMRNKNFLNPDYFGMLARHNIAHVFNSWNDMPPVNEQMAMPGSRTSPNLCAARFLLKPGRQYQEAVDMFQPYNQIKEPYLEGREAAFALLAESLEETRREAYIYVNNRLEGNALETIESMTDFFGRRHVPTKDGRKYTVKMASYGGSASTEKQILADNVTHAVKIAEELTKEWIVSGGWAGAELLPRATWSLFDQHGVKIEGGEVEINR